ncbi:hypothetical protein PR048_018444 [Dryococelus australis]|uniref:Uncharacterized protein n=1 Tax=Dryococelus australis TaxID=614101 RepID=A0ABQ9HCA5_9NEOP|nr:hypothetical protein PR048_018444 [Dryococelus australis]
MQLDSQVNEEAENIKAKLHCIVETIILCGQQDIPLRWDSDGGRLTLDELEKNDRNFRALLHFRANRGLLEIRDNTDAEFHKIFTECENKAKLLGAEKRLPRVVGTQRHRENFPADSPKQYYRRVLFIPYVEELISSLNERFATQKKTNRCLQNILPSYAAGKDLISVEPVFTFYQEDFAGVMGNVGTEMATSPKTYLRNRTGNDKVTGLALIAMHKKPLDIDKIISRFMK